ncbi:MAG: ShlB/FhaC/HecB family hemolysin secretion/activation protein, partial [Neisseria sp.]|nr:ShlB/FhaC/HecB family hemolysin secretion/activation protein [Neisseria sp.]
MYKSRLLPLPVLILSALNAYAANTPNPLDQIDKNVPNQFDKDFRDNLDQIHSVEIQKREQSAWDLQKKQDNDAVAQKVPSENNTECLDYTGIELSGITLIDSKKIEAKLPK